jgi:hypothetical protein
MGGEIVTEGERGAYRYRAADAPKTVSVPAVVAGSVSAVAPERGVYPLYDAIVDTGGASTDQLSRRMQLPASVVVEQGRRLVQLGLVRFTDVGSGRVWRAVRAGGEA